jgi:hypothetical protein
VHFICVYQPFKGAAVLGYSLLVQIIRCHGKIVCGQVPALQNYLAV